MYRTLLVPVDGSPAATAGLDEAIRLAARIPAARHGSIEIRPVIEPGSAPA